jgi:hypothetical protein
MSHEVAIISGAVICGIGLGVWVYGVVRDVRNYMNDGVVRRTMKLYCVRCKSCYPECSIVKYHSGPKARCPNIGKARYVHENTPSRD